MKNLNKSAGMGLVQVFNRTAIEPSSPILTISIIENLIFDVFTTPTKRKAIINGELTKYGVFPPHRVYINPISMSKLA